MISSVVKKTVDGFMSGRGCGQEIEDEINKADKLISGVLRSLCGISGGRAVYYSAMAALLKVILKNIPPGGDRMHVW